MCCQSVQSHRKDIASLQLTWTSVQVEKKLINHDTKTSINTNIDTNYTSIAQSVTLFTTAACNLTTKASVPL